MALTKPNTNQVEKHPDAKKHKYVSFAKSAIRVAAFVFLAYYEIQTAAVLLVIAELVGVAEELV
jgi:diketogulonate reductase-like aldo/keto reductase